MSFDHPGYALKFVQKKPCRDGSSHLFSLIYKFYSPVTRYIYILHADYHEENVFALKFYSKADKRSDYKYSKLTNKGDVSNILITRLKVVPIILKDYKHASFGFIGARTFDKVSKKIEDLKNTQRFRVYRKIVEKTIGFELFDHYVYETISGYLLINKGEITSGSKEEVITKMFSETYQNLLDI